jgi:hypothetical protein
VSRLEFLSRPLVAFDPEIKEHRRIYWEFETNNAWGHSPFRFIVPEDHGDMLPAMIQRQMVEYYMHKEFGRTAPRVGPGWTRSSPKEEENG